MSAVASQFPLGRLSAVVGVFDVESVSYSRDASADTVRVRLEVLVPDHVVAHRLRRRLLRCIGVIDVVAAESTKCTESAAGDEVPGHHHEELTCRT